MRIEFFILEAADELKTRKFTCRLIEKIYREHQSVYVHMKERREVEGLNNLLWTYNDISFIPHNIYEPGVNEDTPVLIGCDTTAPAKDFLFNFALQPPQFLNQFSKIYEIVSGDKSMQGFARERYRRYREQNYELIIHKIKNEASRTNMSE